MKHWQWRTTALGALFLVGLYLAQVGTKMPEKPEDWWSLIVGFIIFAATTLMNDPPWLKRLTGGADETKK